MNATVTAETISAERAAGDLFPDRPLSSFDTSGANWQRHVGKRLTLPEKKRIFGKADMAPWPPKREFLPVSCHTCGAVEPILHIHRILTGAEIAQCNACRYPAPAAEAEAEAPLAALPAPEPVAAVDAPVIASDTGWLGESDRAQIADWRMANLAESRTMSDGAVWARINDEPRPRCTICGDSLRVDGTPCAKPGCRMQRERLAANAAASVAAHTCPSCSTPAEPTDKFCGECGLRLGAEPAALCKACDDNTANPADAAGYCDRCRRDIDDQDRHAAGAAAAMGAEPDLVEHRGKMVPRDSVQVFKSCHRCNALIPVAWISNCCEACRLRTDPEPTPAAATAHEAPNPYADGVKPFYAGIEELRREITDHEADTAPAGAQSITSKYHGQNPARILAACPHATDVRGFHDWLKAGRVVRKGEKGIGIFTPPTYAAGEDADGVIDEKRARRPGKRAYVFDISQTDILTPKDKQAAAAAKPALAPGFTPFPPATHVPPPPAPALRAADI